MNRALFLDRDGTVNHLVYYAQSREWEAPRTVADLQMIAGAGEPLRRLAQAGWMLFIVTNQPSFAKGKTSREALLAVNDRVVELLGDAGAPITRSWICLHHPEGIVPEVSGVCECRKPAIGSLREAERQFGVDVSRSWMVGDQDSDILCGKAAGCRTALLEHPGSGNKRGAVEPDLRCASLDELADHLLRQ